MSSDFSLATLHHWLGHFGSLVVILLLAWNRFVTHQGLVKTLRDENTGFSNYTVRLEHLLRQHFPGPMRVLESVFDRHPQRLGEDTPAPPAADRGVLKSITQPPPSPMTPDQSTPPPAAQTVLPLAPTVPPAPANDTAILRPSPFDVIQGQTGIGVPAASMGIPAKTANILDIAAGNEKDLEELHQVIGVLTARLSPLLRQLGGLGGPEAPQALPDKSHLLSNTLISAGDRIRAGKVRLQQILAALEL